MPKIMRLTQIKKKKLKLKNDNTILENIKKKINYENDDGIKIKMR